MSLWLKDPPSYHLWTLRHLLVVVLLTPVLLPVLRHRALGAAALTGLLVWHVLIDPSPSAASFLIAGDLLGFGVGAYVAFHRLPIPRLRPATARIALAVYLAASAALAAAEIHAHPGGLDAATPLTKALALGGAVLLVGSYRPDWAVFRLPLVRRVGAMSFFVYVAHEPLLSIVRRAVVLVAGPSLPVLVSQFFLVPLATLALVVAIGRQLNDRVPRVYAMLIGGRVSRPERPFLVVVEGGLARTEAPARIAA